MTPHKKRARYVVSARKLAKRNGLEFNPDDWELIWSILDRYEEPTYVYAIVDANKLVKFGRSVAPGSRLKALQTAHGAELRIWAYCEEGDGISEKEIHRELSEHRIGGEWFFLNNEVRDVISRMHRRACAMDNPHQPAGRFND